MWQHHATGMQIFSRARDLVDLELNTEQCRSEPGRGYKRLEKVVEVSLPCVRNIGTLTCVPPPPLIAAHAPLSPFLTHIQLHDSRGNLELACLAACLWTDQCFKWCYKLDLKLMLIFVLKVFRVAELLC